MEPNWIIDLLESALQIWTDKLSEIWSLLTQTPQSFRGGSIWGAVSNISGALTGIGYGLLILFFAMGVFSSASSFREMQRPEFALRFFIRFAAAKIMVGHAMEIMLAVFEIVGGVVSAAMNSIAGGVSSAAHLPAEIVAAIDDLSFLESIPLWLVSLLGTLLITVLSFVLILTVYGRFFRLYVYTAVAPLPMAAFAGEGTSQHGKAFLKSYTGVCVEGVVIVLACMIYNAFLSGSAYTVDATASAVTMCWEYLGETVFNMLILVGLVRGASRIAKEMFGL